MSLRDRLQANATDNVIALRGEAGMNRTSYQALKFRIHQRLLDSVDLGAIVVNELVARSGLPAGEFDAQQLVAWSAEHEQYGIFQLELPADCLNADHFHHVDVESHHQPQQQTTERAHHAHQRRHLRGAAGAAGRRLRRRETGRNPRTLLPSRVLNNPRQGRRILTNPASAGFFYARYLAGFLLPLTSIEIHGQP